MGVPGGSEISSHRGSGLLRRMALASSNTGSCPTSLEISTSRAICSGHVLSVCTAQSRRALGCKWMKKDSRRLHLTFSDSDHGALCVRDIDYACTTRQQAASQRSYPSRRLLKRNKRPRTRLKPWWTMKRTKKVGKRRVNRRSCSPKGNEYGRTSEWK
jgi:hypothetical protein